MSKTIWLEKEPYWMMILTGGYDGSLWNRMVEVTEGSDILMHWKDIAVWVRGKVEELYGNQRMVCGDGHAKKQKTVNPDISGPGYGFRPCLVPVNKKTMIPSKELLCVPNGTVIKIGALYMGRKPVRIPQNPTYDGDIVSYVEPRHLYIKDSPSEEYTISWLVIDGVLVADRALIKGVSYNNLHEDSLIGVARI